MRKMHLFLSGCFTVVSGVSLATVTEGYSLVDSKGNRLVVFGTSHLDTEDLYSVQQEKALEAGMQKHSPNHALVVDDWKTLEAGKNIEKEIANRRLDPHEQGNNRYAFWLKFGDSPYKPAHFRSMSEYLAHGARFFVNNIVNVAFPRKNKRVEIDMKALDAEKSFDGPETTKLRQANEWQPLAVEQWKELREYKTQRAPFTEYYKKTHAACDRVNKTDSDYGRKANDMLTISRLLNGIDQSIEMEDENEPGKSNKPRVVAVVAGADYTRRLLVVMGKAGFKIVSKVGSSQKIDSKLSGEKGNERLNVELNPVKPQEIENLFCSAYLRSMWDQGAKITSNL